MEQLCISFEKHFTTKDYDLTDEQLDFLTTCANEQGQFELRVKEEPLLQVLIEQNITPISFPDWPDPSDEEAMWGRETKSAEGYYRAEDEALILSGKSIPKLFKNAKDDEARDIIAKAYYNILHRVGNYKDLYKYDCYTALPEINDRILNMKLRRGNSK